MRENEETPHAREKCGAKTRRKSSCKNWFMPNGRCRMHGGMSTGAKTKEGLERIRQGSLKHGRYTLQSKNERALMRSLLRNSKGLIKKMRKELY